MSKSTVIINELLVELFNDVLQIEEQSKDEINKDDQNKEDENKDKDKDKDEVNKGDENQNKKVFNDV